MFFIFLLFLASCTDYALKNGKTGPRIVVFPESLDFGNIQSGIESGQSSFAVINAGDKDLVFEKPSLSGNIRFSLDASLENNYTLSPGQSQEFSVYYEPETFEQNSDIVSIHSNDEENLYKELVVTGNGDAPLMSVSPANIDFGDTSVGCEKLEILSISNQGNLDLTIQSINQMVSPPADIILDLGSISLPAVIQPGYTIDLMIEYSPADINLDESIITIESNDPINKEVEVYQTGNGDIIHWYQEQYLQEEERKVDIVFVVDNSGSMSPYQASLALQISLFIEILSESGVNYHLAFITTDDHIYVSQDGVSWVSNRHNDPIAWAVGVINSIGISGSPYEQGVYQAYNFTILASSDNTGYWREDANYAIIYISDEADFSPGTFSNYINYFDSIKQSVSLLSQHAVVGDYPAGCNFVFPGGGGSVYVQYGWGYYEMTQLYNGNSYSICAPDWGFQMQSLAESVSVRSTFDLSQEDVIEDSIEVLVNGQISSEWSYDEDLNQIVFNSNNIPDPGSSIEINYATLGC